MLAGRCRRSGWVRAVPCTLCERALWPCHHALLQKRRHALNERAGLSEAVSRRGLCERADGAHAPVSQPDFSLWTIDFKGHFRTRSSRFCDPLTV